MKHSLLILMLVVLFQNLKAQNYSIDSIPEQLKENANAVIRNKTHTIKIYSKKKYKETKKIAITILNSKGKSWAQITSHYDKESSSKIKYAYLYDKTGKKIKTMNKGDVKENTGITRNYEAMEFGDNTIQYFKFKHYEYPYTVEFRIERIVKNTMNLPDWAPIYDYNIACQNAQLVLETAVNIKLNHRSTDKKQPVLKRGEQSNIYTWSYTNLPAIPKINLLPNKDKLFSLISLTIENFRISDLNGEMKSWSSFSAFISNLSKGRTVLSKQETDTILAISNNYKNYKDKIFALYKYMQGRTRYVSIQLGIGGFQPFKASYVSDKGYGDCKALSNYMHSILQAANIPSYYALVQAGTKPTPIPIEFPNNHFNHAILCVPYKNDTTWLECTSQSQSAGYLGSFTANRNALLITPTNGSLVRTQTLSPNDNMRSRKIRVTVDTNGNYNLEINTMYRAMRQEELKYKLTHWSKAKLKKDLEKKNYISSSKISNYKHTLIDSYLPIVKEKLEIKSNKSGIFKKKRIFLSTNILTNKGDWYNKVLPEKREFPFEAPMGTTDSDTTEITIPKDFVIESLPNDINLKSKFGEYHCIIKKDAIINNRLLIIRLLVLKKKIFPSEDYYAFREFISTIIKSDGNKIVLRKDKIKSNQTKY